jgi:hypothetical protein
MMAVGLDPTPLDHLRKYSPDQPRVPAGSGRESGRWTDGGGGGTRSASDVQESRSSGYIILASQDKKEGKDKAKDFLDEERRLLGEDSADDDLEHHRPIEPGPTLIFPAGSARSVLIGKNSIGKPDAYMTDLPGGLHEAKALFEQLTSGQTMLPPIDENGTLMLRSTEGIQLRINRDGGIRIDRPLDIDGKKIETIHFTKKGLSLWFRGHEIW